MKMWSKMSSSKGQGGDELHKPLLPVADGEDAEVYNDIEKPVVAEDESVGKPQAKTNMLIFSFVAMIFVGLGNKLFNVFATLPMKNYPNFMNMWTTFIYIPASFAYIIPMQMCGSAISKKETEIPKYKFAVMGILDSFAGIMQVFATTFIPDGGVTILLQQSAIPMSMIITKVLLRVKYRIWQYLGAAVVLIGLIFVVFYPEEAAKSEDDPNKPKPPPKYLQYIWAAIMVLSCLPMTLSSVFKEIALGETEIDVVYLNGWIAVFQFITSLPLTIPAAYAQAFADTSNFNTFISIDPVKNIPGELWRGLKCYVSLNSKTGSEDPAKDDKCLMAPVFVNVYLVFNILYNILIIMILKHGSANVLWVAMTVMVPLSNLTFAIPHIPKGKPFQYKDVIGLVVVMLGLVTYRFGGAIEDLIRKKKVSGVDSLKESEKQWRAAKFIGINGLEVAGPVFQYNRQHQEDKLQRTVHQVRSTYLGRLGITQGGPPRPSPEYYAIQNTDNV